MFFANPCMHSAQNLNKLTGFRSFWNTVVVRKERLLGALNTPMRAGVRL